MKQFAAFYTYMGEIGEERGDAEHILSVFKPPYEGAKERLAEWMKNAGRGEYMKFNRSLILCTKGKATKPALSGTKQARR